MNISVLAKALVVWLGIVVIAIANGFLREQLLFPLMGAVAGLIASGVILCAGIFLVALVSIPWYGRLKPSQYWELGVFWLVFTLLFEFGFGRFVAHKDWSELLQAYTFEGGNLWPIVLVVTLFSPWLAARVRGAA